MARTPARATIGRFALHAVDRLHLEPAPVGPQRAPKCLPSRAGPRSCTPRRRDGTSGSCSRTRARCRSSAPSRRRDSSGCGRGCCRAALRRGSPSRDRDRAHRPSSPAPSRPTYAGTSRPESTRRDSRRRCPCASTAHAAAYTRFGFSPHAIFRPYFAPGNFIPCTVRDGTTLSTTLRPPIRLRRSGQHLQRRHATGEVARKLRILRPDRMLRPHVRRRRVGHLVAVAERVAARRGVDAEVRVVVDDAGRHVLAGAVDRPRRRPARRRSRRPARSCRRAAGSRRCGSAVRRR